VPAFVSRSASLCISSNSRGDGGPAVADLTKYMNRMVNAPLDVASAVSSPLMITSGEIAPNRHAGGKW
jgi:hypothetical protein